MADIKATHDLDFAAAAKLQTDDVVTDILMCVLNQQLISGFLSPEKHAALTDALRSSGSRHVV